jgi:hypothetical protein
MKNTVCAALLFAAALLCIACPQQTDPRAGDPFADPGDNTLVGTLWAWDGNWGYRTLAFESETEAVYSDGYYDPPEKTRVHYVFHQETGAGLMDIYGPFARNGGRLEFSDWKKYGHGAEYVLLGETP